MKPALLMALIAAALLIWESCRESRPSGNRGPNSGGLKDFIEWQAQPIGHSSDDDSQS